MPVVFATLLGLVFSCSYGPCHHARQVAYSYPHRCQYFDSANAPENKAYCDKWFSEHEDR